MTMVWTYAIYLVVSVAVTVWVARTLHKNGRVFLVDSMAGNETLADSVNHLLVVGFYLINVGYVAWMLRATEHVTALRQAIELLADKLGTVLLVLGLMHFFNLYVFSRIRRRALDSGAPFVPPDAVGPRPEPLP